MSEINPGWYSDGNGNTRWWDGTAWTDHVSIVTSAPQRNMFSRFSLALGIISMLIPFTFGILAPVAILAIVFGAVGIHRSKSRREGFKRGIWGVVLGSVALLFFFGFGL